MEKEITPTPASTILDKTKALPEIPCGAAPLVYDQIIRSADAAYDAKVGKPDPAHSFD